MNGVLAFLDYTKKLTELDLDIPKGACKIVDVSHAECKICGVSTFIGEEQMYALGVCENCFNDYLHRSIINQDELQKS